MKKPYFCIRAISTMVFILLLQTSFAQEVETQQQTNPDVATVTQESGGDGISVYGPTGTSKPLSQFGITSTQWDILTPTSPSTIFPTDKSYNNVDMSTGKATVRVPLATAGTSDMKIPIDLSYTTGGIKLRDVASWVGLGWNLSAGGKITRALQKYRDTIGSIEPLLDYRTWIAKNELEGIKGNFDARAKKDTQPDLFYFDIPGKSGMFVFDNLGETYTIPYQNIKIDYDNVNSTFTITDDAGTRYLFDDIETTTVTTDSVYVQDRQKVFYESTWNLSKIITIRGEQIDFEYKTLGKNSTGTDLDYVEITYSKSLITGDNDANNDFFPHTRYTTTVSPLYLTKISWKNGSMEFVSSKGREDIPEEAYKLDAIKLYADKEGTKLVKSFNFEYSVFVDSRALKLDKINVTSPTSATREFYRKFEYYTDKNLPKVLPYYDGVGGYYDLDHWGYYNNEKTTAGASRGIPRFNPIPNSTLGITRPAYDDRTPNFELTRANSLKRVWVSSSGYDEFEYELNTEKFKFSSTEIGVVGGLRIKSITSKSEELGNVVQKVRYDYSDDNALSSGVVFTEPRYYHLASTKFDSNGVGHDNYVVKDSPINSLFDLDGAHIRYGKVKEIFDNGSSNTYYYTTYADYPDLEYPVHSVLYPSISITYKHLVDNYYNFAPMNTRFWKRGLLKEKISRNVLNLETHREKYEYNLNAPVKKIIKGIFPFLGQKIEGVFETGVQYPLMIIPPYLADYEYVSQPIYMSKKTVSGVDVPETITEYIYDDGDSSTSDLDHLLLKKQIETSGADKYTTTYKYPFDYSNQAGTENGNAIAFMKANYISSTPIEVVQYKGNNVTGGKVYIYDTWHNFTNGEITGAIFNLREVKELLLKKPKIDIDFRGSGYTREDGGYRFTCDAGYVAKAAYEYNRNNKINCIKERNKPSQSFLYGDNQDLPIAQIINAEAKKVNGAILNEAFYTSFEDTDGTTHARAKTGTKVLTGGYYTDMSQLAAGSYWVSYWQSYNGGVDWELYETEVEVMENDGRQFTIGGQGTLIDEYRIWKKGSQMQTKTYDASFNVTSETDENGKTTYYTYDAFGRLISVSDNNRDTLKSYKYYLKQ